MLNLKPTYQSQELSNFEQFVEIVSEVQELGGAITRGDVKNIGEEIMDVMQWCINIASRYNLDIHKEEILHQAKLYERGYDFIV